MAIELIRAANGGFAVQRIQDDAGGLLAAEYVRMSTHMQTCSPEMQRQAIRGYAGERNIRIVKSYNDEGRSGLTFSGRPGLQSLVSEIQAGLNEYSILLVYDVSRWGRFQDTDESAYYEYICRRAGVLVTYCAEPFQNDATAYSSLIKSMKRIMAAEFSRDLSRKTYHGQALAVGLGFANGGTAGFGLTRDLVSADGIVRSELQPGQQKALRTDRVRLRPGRPAEVETVQKIFDLWTNIGRTTAEIANGLNGEGAPTIGGRPWTSSKVSRILNNERYAGTMVYGRTSARLSTPRVRKPETEWVRTPEAFSAIVDSQTFMLAKERARSQPWKRTDRDILIGLQRLWQRRGHLSRDMIDAEPDLPSYSTVAARFGGLRRAFDLIGYPDCNRPTHAPDVVGFRRSYYRALSRALVAAGYNVRSRRVSGILEIGPITLAICVTTEMWDASLPLWRIEFGPHRPAIGIVVRLHRDASLLDCYVLPEDFPFNRRHFWPEHPDTCAPAPVALNKVSQFVVAAVEAVRVKSRLAPGPRRMAARPWTTGPKSRITSSRSEGPHAGDRRAQAKRAWVTHRMSDEDLLDRLHKLWERTGWIDYSLVLEDPSTPSITAYASRFGSLKRAFLLAGCVEPGKPSDPGPNSQIERRARTKALVEELNRLGEHAYRRHSQMLDADGLGISLLICPSEMSANERLWRIKFGHRTPTHVGVIVRMTEHHQPLDFIVVSATDLPLMRAYFVGIGGGDFAPYRCAEEAIPGLVRDALERHRASPPGVSLSAQGP